MYTPLFETSLADLCKQPMMIDANILMVGIENRACDSKCHFENMRELYIQPLFHCFQSIIIHEMVYNELDPEFKSLYKRYCEDVIKRHGLPATLLEYVSACADHIQETDSY